MNMFLLTQTSSNVLHGQFSFACLYYLIRFQGDPCRYSCKSAWIYRADEYAYMKSLVEHQPQVI